MLDDSTAITKMNNERSAESYAARSGEMEQKCFIAWSALDDNKFLFKHRYVSCSRSVPRRSKRFIQYRISRSLNFDASVRSSSSENSSFEEDKHLSRSAKIMRALNCNGSPAYYGKTKIKKSLNFNLTPSPKRFMPARKTIRKSLSLNFNSPLSVSKKYLQFDDYPSDSASSQLLFSSSESIDENQNQTPSQQSTKDQDMLHYSTPNAKLSRRALCSGSFTPLLRSKLKETVDNIVYIDATPNSQTLERAKSRTKCTNGISMNTSRNLFYEFHDKEDDRPSTPENVIHIIPESMSAIKRSHKKERSSRRSERSDKAGNDEAVLRKESGLLSSLSKTRRDAIQDDECQPERCCTGDSDSNELAFSHSEDDMSDTGSIFDYAGEQEHASKEKECRGETGCAASHDNVCELRNLDIEAESEDGGENRIAIQHFGENELPRDGNDASESNSNDRDMHAATSTRSITPEPESQGQVFESQKTVTPENRINILQRVAIDSIKKSHKKTKDTNKRRLFSPMVLKNKIDIVEKQGTLQCLRNFEQNENIEEQKRGAEESRVDDSRVERSCTPEKVNSSRLLLTQFSSVKKSHKKDKHTKILSGFLKRQEFFGKDLDPGKCNRYKAFSAVDVSDYDNSADDLDANTNADEHPGSPVAGEDADASPDKLSPSKRKKVQDRSGDYEASVSSDSELHEFDTSKEEFQIFTPLKRKRSVIASPAAKEYLHFYDAPSDNSDLSEEAIANISCSRCLTPVAKFPSAYTNAEQADATVERAADNVRDERANVDEEDRDDNDGTGRSTPRNMSTAELYVNLDSIKKSHKKNKRGIGARKVFDLARNKCYASRMGDASMENIENEAPGTLDLSSDYATDGNDNHRRRKSSSDESCSSPANDDEKQPSPEIEPASSNVTPPNCLKMKNYIRLLRETSIKRSHKKVRDQKKQEYAVDASDELSDDGSIFDNEEKLDYLENESTRD